MKKMSSCGKLALAVIAAAVTWQGASAAPPNSGDRNPNAPTDASTTVTFGYPEPDPEKGRFTAVCPFPVTIVITGKSKASPRPLPDGVQVISSPALKATVINGTNGNEVTLSITGTLRLIPTNDGFFNAFATGRNLLLDLRTPLDGGLKLVSGNFRYALSAYPGFIVGDTPQGTGRVVDVCSLIE